MTELLTLAVEPTYTLPVNVPRQGKKDAEVEITYKVRKPDEMVALEKRFRDDKVQDLEAVQEVASGWGLADAFTPENIERALVAHPGFAGAVLKAYFREYERVRLGN